MDSRVPGKNGAIDKALTILTLFIPENLEMGTREISEKLGFHKATTSRILLTLTRRGFLQQDATTKMFKLGRSSLNLGQAVIEALRTGLVQLAKPYMDGLAADVQSSVVLEQLVNDKAIISDVAKGPRRIRVAGDVGDSVAINAAAGAKAMLAFSSPAVVERVIRRNSEFQSLTPNTITRPDLFRRNLQDVRRNGYSLDNEEIDIGIKAIGVPIFDFRNTPVAALAVVFPAHRLGATIDPEILTKIKKTAEAISAAFFKMK
jgi:IclR family transcriptional regulator, KDG regulon repressor